MNNQSRWENQRDIDCSEHNQPKCEKFPDCSCNECHETHLEHGDFNKFCSVCSDEKCQECNGAGWIRKAVGESYDSPEWDEFDCEKCGGSGRVKEK